MKKKILIYVMSIVIALIVLGMIFYITDFYRAKTDQVPIFALKYEEVNDGGTAIYVGFGYKIIDYNRYDGKDDTVMGSWFLQYEEPLNTNKEGPSNIEKMSLEDLPLEYSPEQAIEDNCFLVAYSNIYNKARLDEFMRNVNNFPSVEDTIRIVQFTMEGDMIISQLSYTKEGIFELERDSRRDEFSSQEDRIIRKQTYPGGLYGVYENKEDEYTEVWLALKAEINYVSESDTLYPNILLCTYKNDAKIQNKYPSFTATILEVRGKSVLVKPVEGEEALKSSDKISGGIPEDDDTKYVAGMRVEVTYTGEVMESYPAQIRIIDIKEIKENI